MYIPYYTIYIYYFNINSSYCYKQKEDNEIIDFFGETPPRYKRYDFAKKLMITRDASLSGNSRSANSANVFWRGLVDSGGSAIYKGCL